MKNTDSPIRVLLLSDDTLLSSLLTETLMQEGLCLTARSEKTDTDLLQELRSGTYDILLCCCHTPSDSLRLLQEIRQTSDIAAMLILHAAPVSSLIEAYENGADDVFCISSDFNNVFAMPLSVKLLALKIKALYQRISPAEPATTYQVGRYIFDANEATLSSGSEVVHRLTGRESRLLALLLEHRGQLVNRGLILKRLWGEDTYFNARSLSVFANRLRHILEGEDVKIVCVRGGGYRIS